ncbi:O-antigen translocase [Roseateles sp.]|uniref:O-antigen translocase n=1 Tax=Roseateles sp. TaxID=1971397 RepID=UPI0031E00A6B
MNLAKTTILNGIAVLVRIATTLSLNKVFAVAIGPTGYAVVGQFQNLITAVTALTSGALSTGVTKYTAEYGGERARQIAAWRTAFGLNLVACVVCALVLLLWREPIARRALADVGLAGAVAWLAGALFLSSISALLIAILNGLKLVSLYVTANIVGSLLTAVLAGALVYGLGLQGALIALAVSPAAALAFTGWLFFRHVGTPLRELIGRPDPTQSRLLGGFALIGLAGALLPPLSQTAARYGISTSIGLHDTGLWQALMRISDTHLMLLTTTLSVYLLPRLSEIRTRDELRHEVVQGQKFIVPLVVTTALVLWLSREWLITALLSPAFRPLADVLGLQLIGDVVKISSWIFAYTLISRAKTRAYLINEFVFALLSPALTVAGAHYGGLTGTAAAYIAVYLLYWVSVWALYTGLLKSDFPSTRPLPATDAPSAAAN